MTTRELFETFPGLSRDERAFLLQVLSTRGATKDRVLKSCPTESRDPARWAIWQSVVGYLAPNRTSLFSLMMMREEARTAYDWAEQLMQRPGPLGQTLWWWIRIVEPAFRWNMMAHRFDVEKAIAAYNKELNNV